MEPASDPDQRNQHRIRIHQTRLRIQVHIIRFSPGSIELALDPNPQSQLWIRIHKNQLRVRIHKNQLRFRIHKTQLRIRIHIIRSCSILYLYGSGVFSFNILPRSRGNFAGFDILCTLYLQ